MTGRDIWQLDHITVVARTIEEGMSYIRERLGIDMPSGGQHPRMGTHNRLLGLGNDSFLELIAIDPAAQSANTPRWFDLDHFRDEPCLATWVLGTNDIEFALSQAHPDSGTATEITRDDLNWLISIPADGSMPLQGAFPTLIQWPEGPHPAARMVDLGCRLKELSIEHPRADEIIDRIGGRLDTSKIKIAVGPNKIIRAQISTPKGLRTLT